MDVPAELLYELRQLEDMFVVTQAELKRITHHFAQELEKGMPHTCMLVILLPIKLILGVVGLTKEGGSIVRS